ncbi:hypothetical protein SH449x_004084 [Pirellulaceae bacterium SH449]
MITKNIEIENIGPVERLVIPVPEEGGLVVLQGRNGVGKSNSLEAVQGLATGKGKLSVRDGALKGSISGLGATITVGRSTRRLGELEVETIEGKLSIADLVDPGLKSDDAADAKRIKALVSLTGASASASEFYKLLGSKERFEKLVSPNACDCDDWVSMAERIKRDIEKEARKEEDLAEYQDGKARGYADVAEQFDGVIEDPAVLKQELMEAAQEVSTLQERRKQAIAAADRAKKETERMARLSDGLDDRIQMLRTKKKNSESDCEVYQRAIGVMEKQIAELQSNLQQARQKLSSESSKLKDITERLGEAINDQVEVEELQQSSSTLPASVELEEIEAAKARFAAIEARIEAAAIAREAAAKVEEARAIKHKAAEHRRNAIELRNAAKGTDDVLSELVGRTCNVLRVEHGRLVLDTNRGATYFAELSHGERWKLAIDIAVDQLGNNGIVVVPQEAFEGLDPIARAVINDHAKHRRVLVLTAENSASSEIEAREFEPEEINV